MKRFAAIAFLLFEIYLISSFVHSIFDLYQKQDEVKKEAARVEALRIKNAQLKSQLVYVQTDEFIEKEAREKLHFVKPDETVVMISQDVLKAATSSAQPPPKIPNWMAWIRLFFY